MTDTTNQIFVSLNGEIYNYRELLQEAKLIQDLNSYCDTEAIIWLYKKWEYLSRQKN